LIKTNLEGEAHLVILKIFDDGVQHLEILDPSSGVLRNITFQELDLFQSSGEGVGDILLGPLERANINHWTKPFLMDPTEYVPPTPRLWMETGSFQNAVLFHYRTMGKVKGEKIAKAAH
jgi:hypothetical protein